MACVLALIEYGVVLCGSLCCDHRIAGAALAGPRAVQCREHINNSVVQRPGAVVVHVAPVKRSRLARTESATRRAPQRVLSDRAVCCCVVRDSELLRYSLHRMFMTSAPQNTKSPVRGLKCIASSAFTASFLNCTASSLRRSLSTVRKEDMLPMRVSIAV